jgi:hypothetical protein
MVVLEQRKNGVPPQDSEERCGKMEEKLLETLHGYRDAARKLKEAAPTIALEGDMPEEVQTALVRMAEATSLNEKLSLCEAFLNEETPEEVAEAFYEAQEEISRVMDGAFLEVDKYSSDSEEFQRQVELLSANSESSGLTDDLLKLYKCEGIIRMAYGSMQKVPIIGTPGYTMTQFEEQEAEHMSDIERTLLEKTGVDVYALLEIRTKLIESVRRTLKGDMAEKE